MFGEALTQLSGLRAWFATQRELHLLGSSVLIVYEGDAAAATRKTRVCVIDFCNYVDARGELDDNFASGLDRLAEMMRSIVDSSGMSSSASESEDDASSESSESESSSSSPSAATARAAASSIGSSSAGSAPRARFGGMPAMLGPGRAPREWRAPQISSSSAEAADRA